MFVNLHNDLLKTYEGKKKNERIYLASNIFNKWNKLNNFVNSKALVNKIRNNPDLNNQSNVCYNFVLVFFFYLFATI